MRCGRGLSTVLHPSSPARPQGAGATYRSARPPGATARPGWVRRALSLGRKRNRWMVGARSLATSSAENRGRRGRAGAGAERRGARGRWGRNLPNSRAQFRGGPGKQAGEQPAGAALLEWGGRGCPLSPGINYCLGVLVPARAASEAQRPPSRLSAPRRKSWGWEPAGKAGLGWLGIRGPEVGGGRRGRGGECRMGEGPGNCGRGWEGPRGPVGGRKWEGSPRRRERMEWLGGGL